MASVLNQPYFHDEKAAFAALEGIMWPGGKPDSCPHCGVVGKANRLADQISKPSKRNPEGKPVYGLWKCYACRQQFTVRKGTIFEESRLPLHLWFQAAHLMCSSKKGVSANQLHRTLGCTLKTAWFVAHRLRLAMTEGNMPPLGGEGKTIEADETYFGRREGYTKERGTEHKIAIVSLVERGGKAHSVHVGKARKKDIDAIVKGRADAASVLMTDESKFYADGLGFAEHHSVIHSIGQYGRGTVHTNTIEGFFSIFKRGMKGVYQHCSEKHLHRYLAEFDFRYNNRVALGVNDLARMDAALKGAAGKRLTYGGPR